MRAVSLFCGAGGMDVGFAAAGADIVWASEIDTDAAQTYRLNHPGAALCQGDIRETKSGLRAAVGDDVDLVFGGPPCQGFSVAGKMDPDDERSKLIWEFLDVVRIVQPSIFVMENVKALGELARWHEIRSKIVKRAAELGYHCFFRVLNSADFDVPQKRERVFFIGYKGKRKKSEAAFDRALTQLHRPRKNLRECLLELPRAGTEGNPFTCTAKISLAANPVLRKSPYAGMLFNGLGRPLDLDSQANTLPASMGGNKTPILDEKVLEDAKAENWVIEHHRKLWNGEAGDDDVPDSLRRITTLEAAAIQTFPSGYQFFGEKSSVYRQIGNAVPCHLAEAVARAAMGVLAGVQQSY